MLSKRYAIWEEKVKGYQDAGTPDDYVHDSGLEYAIVLMYWREMLQPE